MYDNIIIHSYPRDKSGIRALVSFRNGRKIVIRAAFKDMDAVVDYFTKHQFCQQLPIKVITHN